MGGIKLYGMWSSPFMNCVAFTLHEKNVDFEMVYSDIKYLKSEEYLETKNPFGKMPAFEDGDVVLFESRAIARYVAAKYENQGTPLMGKSLKEQALVNVWTEVESQTLLPTLWPICFEFYRKKVPDQGVIQTNLEKLNQILDVYEAQLSKHKYLAGDFFSLADLFHVPLLHFFTCVTDDKVRSVITSHPRVNAWYQDTRSRPAWQKIVKIPQASDWSHVPKY